MLMLQWTKCAFIQYDINKSQSNKINDNHIQLRKTSVVSWQTIIMINFMYTLCIILLLIILLILETNGCQCQGLVLELGIPTCPGQKKFWLKVMSWFIEWNLSITKFKHCCIYICFCNWKTKLCFLNEFHSSKICRSKLLKLCYSLVLTCLCWIILVWINLSFELWEVLLLKLIILHFTRYIVKVHSPPSNCPHYHPSLFLVLSFFWSEYYLHEGHGLSGLAAKLH